MMDTLRWLLNHPVVTLLSLILNLVLAIGGVFLGFKSWRVKKPYWAIRSNNLVSDYRDTLPSLDIRYNQEPVQNLTTSRLVFWNAGSETIQSTDIAEGDPLCLKAEDNARFLDVSVLQENSNATRWRATRAADQRSIRLSFDFLDPRNGVVLQIIHSGKSSDDISVAGTIKGARALQKRSVLVDMDAKTMGKYILLATALIFVTSIWTTAPFVSKENVYLMAIETVVNLTFVVVMIGMWRRLGSARSTIPRGLEKFAEDL